MRNKEDILRIVSNVREELKKIYEERLRGTYLFGSYAREDGGEDSDIDIAVVLDKISSKFAEIDRTINLASDLTLEHGILINLFFIQEEDLKQGIRSIHRTIKREGIYV